MGHWSHLPGGLGASTMHSDESFESSKRHSPEAPPGRHAKDDDDRPAKAKKKEAKPRAAHKSKRK